MAIHHASSDVLTLFLARAWRAFAFGTTGVVLVRNSRLPGPYPHGPPHDRRPVAPPQCACRPSTLMLWASATNTLACSCGLRWLAMQVRGLGQVCSEAFEFMAPMKCMRPAGPFNTHLAIAQTHFLRSSLNGFAPTQRLALAWGTAHVAVYAPPGSHLHTVTAHTELLSQPPVSQPLNFSPT